MGFTVVRYYDACCDRCGNWYAAEFPPYNGANKKQAIDEMKRAGWSYKKGLTLCQFCSVGEER